MPINIVWEDDEKTILRMILSGKWTLEEFHDGFSETLTLYRSVPHDIDLIIDARRNQTNMLNIISSLGRLDADTRPNHRSVTVVGINPMLRVVGSASLKIAPHLSRNLGFVETVEDARARILQLRARRSAGRA